MGVASLDSLMQSPPKSVIALIDVQVDFHMKNSKFSRQIPEAYSQERWSYKQGRTRGDNP